MRFRNVDIVGQGEIPIDFELDSGTFKGIDLIDLTYIFGATIERVNRYTCVQTC